MIDSVRLCRQVSYIRRTKFGTTNGNTLSDVTVDTMIAYTLQNNQSGVAPISTEFKQCLEVIKSSRKCC